MDNKKKCEILRAVRESEYAITYYKALESFGDLKQNYGDYMISEPIDYASEFKRIPDADYELCCALLSMILCEDDPLLKLSHPEEVRQIVDRMIELLEKSTV